MELIDKAAVVKEIKRRYKILILTMNKLYYASTYKEWEAVAKEYRSFLSFIDKLEVKEVDLKKEMDREWSKCKPIDEGMGLEIASIDHEQFDNIAKHFYNLGKQNR